MDAHARQHGHEDGHEGGSWQAGPAWRDFRRRLADVLAGLPPGARLTVGLADESAPAGSGGAPEERSPARPQVLIRVGSGRLHGEVRGDRVLAPDRRLGADQLHRMRTLGWSGPRRSGTHHAHRFDLEQREADRAAVLLVRTLQEVFAALHPCFLRLAGDGADGLVPPAPNEPASGAAVPGERAVALVRPRDSEELRHHVGRFLDHVLADQVWERDDGSWFLWAGPCPVVLSVRDHAPVVDIESRVLERVADRERALLEVNLCNRDSGGMRFVLDDDVVLARMDVFAMPWAPQHLVRAVREFRRHVELTALDLVQRLGGRRVLDPDPQPSLAPPAPWTPLNRPQAERLAAIRDLRRSGPVDAEVVAAVHDDDRKQIVRQILWVRRTQGPGEPHEEEQDLLALLREALRLVAEREAQSAGPH